MKYILTLGLALSTLTAYSQLPGGFSHKDLGLGYKSFAYTSLPNTTGAVSPRDLLNADSVKNVGSEHKAMVRKFAQRFPGQESVVLTSSLLDTLAATRSDAAGVHLFLGSKNGKLEVILTHTHVDTLKVNQTFAKEKNAITYDSASNYNIVYDRAYYWDNQHRNWQVVEDKGTLDQDVLTSRKRAQIQYGYRIQGYYLSKDLLLRIRKESGQGSLTVFLGQQGNIFHLIVPILSKTSSDTPVFLYATDYESTVPLHHKATAINLAPPPPKDHNTVRPCQPYCGN